MEKMQKLKIDYPVIVEGKYDRLRLSNVIDAHIVKTDGFGIFKKKETQALIRALAKKSKIIVLTDSDGGGKVIRSHISGLVPKERIIPLYIPQIKGKEKRKEKPSAEGTMGVEGMEFSLLYELFLPFASDKDLTMQKREITKYDLYAAGLTGKERSSEKRDALCEMISLPAGMTPNALLAALNIICTYEEFAEVASKLDKDNKGE